LRFVKGGLSTIITPKQKEAPNATIFWFRSSLNKYLHWDPDTDFKRVFKKRISNNLDLILETLEPYRDQLKGLVCVVESTFNWYWLVDGLMDAGYGCVHLANPSAIKQYEGLKHSDDQHDAFFLAQLLILGILPQGYIYPKEDRPVRDLARKRMFLVKHKTAHILSLQSLIALCCNQRVSSNQLRTFTRGDLEQLLKEEHLIISAQANLDSILFLKQQIHALEKVIKNKLKLSPAFSGLLTVPGIGQILAMTIILEVGDIGRFTKVGNFTSYCRCAPTQRLSDGKSKGSGNRKNGNRYLSGHFQKPPIWRADTTSDLAVTMIERQHRPIRSLLPGH
jgi:transposase